jgi:putative membrane protein
MVNKEIETIKKLDWAAIAISIVVLGLVVLMRQVKIDVGINFHFLPPVHAVLNTLTAISLVAAVRFIKQKNVVAHQRMINIAMLLSAAFLGCYVAYHFTTEETRYGGVGAMRYVYFLLLITHIVLAATMLPFILFTYTRGYMRRVDSHKRLARWVFPLWLYVAVSGPICYLMLMPYYK